mgnify:CR=1 FL=1
MATTGPDLTQRPIARTRMLVVPLPFPRIMPLNHDVTPSFDKSKRPDVGHLGMPSVPLKSRIVFGFRYADFLGP